MERRPQKRTVLHRLWCQSIKNAGRVEIMSAAVSKTNIPLKDLLLRKLLRDDVDDPASHGQETDVAGVFFFSFFLLKKCCDHQICQPTSGLEISKQPQQVNLTTTVCTTMNVCQRTTCSHCSNCRGISFFMRQQRNIIILSAFFLLSPKHIPKHFSSFGGSSTRQAR